MCGFCLDNQLSASVNKFEASSGLGGFVYSALPTYSNDQIAHQLTNGYWQTNGYSPRSFDVSVGGTISVNITDLGAAAQTLARSALDLWSNATGLNFSYTSGTAQIEFGDSDAWSAYSWSDGFGTTTTYSYVNVGTSWVDYYGTSIDSYSFQTYIHEIGHALGLGHAGNYNGSADYGIDNHYSNDSWQASVMSYFSQTENTSINASFAWVVTPQVADIIAIQNLYGTTSTARTGNTTYGDNANSGDLYQTFNSVSSSISATVIDGGGIDTFDFSGSSYNQIIDLREEMYSSVRGYTGNLSIARGTVIENAIGGSGSDTLLGNAADNNLYGGAGNDYIHGHMGNNYISGGEGIDYAYFEYNISEYIFDFFDSGIQIIGDYVDKVVADVEYFVFSDGTKTLEEVSQLATPVSIEANGAVELLKTHRYFISDGSSQIAVTNNGSNVGSSSYAGWEAIQVEAVGSGYKLLWQYQDGRYLYWDLDANGNQINADWISDIRDMETLFQADIDNDGNIGHVTSPIESNGAYSLLALTDSDIFV